MRIGSALTVSAVWAIASAALRKAQILTIAAEPQTEEEISHAVEIVISVVLSAESLKKCWGVCFCFSDWENTS
jgi:hypothetical protein